MEFKMVSPIKTVYLLLEKQDSIKILHEPIIVTATTEIVDDGKKSRQQIQREIKQKEAAIDHIARKYARLDLSDETIKQCLYSISDNNSFLTFNRDPVDRMIEYMTTYFSPNSVEKEFSLAIHGGMN